MSNFLGKTVGTLTNLIGNVGLTNNESNKNKHSLFSSFERSSFIQKIRAATSKKEKESVISSFITSAEKFLSQPNVSEAEVENYVKLSLVCESLGYSVPFIYIHAIKLAQKGNLQQKHTGYLAASALLHPGHELVMLLINTIQKDLESSNYAEVLLGLKSTCNLINSDTVDNVIYLVEQKLNHNRSEVKELAALTLGHCLTHVQTENIYKILLPKLEKHLCDSNLAFVSKIVTLIYNIVKKCTGDFSYLIGTLVQLQTQLLKNRVPSDMEYRNIPAPWLQITVVNFMGFLCRNSEQSQQIFPVLKLTLQKAEVNHNMTYAIISACISTIVSIPNNKEMIELSLKSASKLLISPNKNLKYTGIEAFVAIARKTKPMLTNTQQESIMECLSHSDEMLKYKALELLCFLANPANAEAVCNKLIPFLKCPISESLKIHLAVNILEIAIQYKTENHRCFISIIQNVLSHSDISIPDKKIAQIINIITKDNALKEIAKKSFCDICIEKYPSQMIVKILASILDDISEFEICLPKIIEEQNELSCLWFLASFRNYAFLHKSKISKNICDILKNAPFPSIPLQQIQREISQLVDVFDSIPNTVFDSEIDPTLTFLDNYVYKALMEGENCYKPQRLRTFEPQVKVDSKLNSVISESSGTSLFWDKESKLFNDSISPKSLSYASISSTSFQNPASSSTASESLTKIKNVWTKEGRIENKEIPNEKSTDQSEKNVDELHQTDDLFAGVS